MATTLGLTVEDRTGVGQANQQTGSAIADAADRSAIQRGQYVFFAAFDGTNTDRAKATAGKQESNVSVLERQVSEGLLQGSSVRGATRYFGGVKQEALSPITWLLDVTIQSIEIAEAAYTQFASLTKEWLEEDSNASITVVLASYSRGAAAAAIFSQMVYERGVRVGGATLIAPGQVAVAAGVLLDPVVTSVSGNLAFAPHDRNIVSIVASNERRWLYPLADYSAQSRAVQRFTMYGNHGDVGGTYAEGSGIGAQALQAATDFLRNSGVPVSTIPDSRQFRGPSSIEIHNEAYTYVLDGGGTYVKHWEEDNSINQPAPFKLVDAPRRTLVPQGFAPATASPDGRTTTMTLYNGNVVTIAVPSSDTVEFKEVFVPDALGTRTEFRHYGDGTSRSALVDKTVATRSADGVEQSINSVIYLNGAALGQIDLADATRTVVSMRAIGGAEFTASLTGGRGFGLYQIDSGANVSISDVDGLGQIARQGASTRLGIKESEGVWTSSGTVFTRSADGTQLVLSFLDKPQDSVVINGFDFARARLDGYLGIRLSDSPTLQAPATENAIFGDREPIDADPSQDGVQTQVDALGNIVTNPSAPSQNRPDTLYDSDANDDIRAGGGDDVVILARSGDDHVDAGSGNDLITASGTGRKVVLAGAGTDQVFGGAADDWIEGGADADILSGGGGHDVIHAASAGAGDIPAAVLAGSSAAPVGGQGELLAGGGGADTIFAAHTSDLVLAGDHSDIVVAGGGDDTVYGDANLVLANVGWTLARSIVVTDAVNYNVDLVGVQLLRNVVEGGNDAIYAGAGEDWIFAGAGDDHVEGGSDNDVLHGEAGNDFLAGGEGDDILVGDSGEAQVAGLGGTDYLQGGAGDDVLDGGAAADVLLGGEGDDQLIGGSGEDTLVGGLGSDVLRGGAGKDTYVFNRGDGIETIVDTPSGADDPEASVLVLGEGIHAEGIRFRRGSLLVDLGNGDAIHFEGFNSDDPQSTPVLSAIQFADGMEWSYADVLAIGFDFEGTEDSELIVGTGVTDRINARGGDDLVFAQAGDDTIDGGAGNDAILAGRGADVLDGGEGDDNLQGEQGSDELRGGDGNDSLSGGFGIDTLLGGDGDDTLQGDEDDDVLDGSLGADVLQGGEGSDRYRIRIGEGMDTIEDAEGANVIEFGPGITLGQVSAEVLQSVLGDAFLHLSFGPDGAEDLLIRLNFAQAAGSTFTFHFEEGIFSAAELLQAALEEPLDYRAGEDAIALTGGPSADQMVGSDHADRLDGGAGDDTLRARGGADVVVGGAGDDYLDGGSGDDYLEGGDGGDRYRLATGMGRDAIVETNEGVNVLELDPGISLAALRGGRQGDDLLIHFPNRREGVVLKGYFAEGAAQQWSVRDADGVSAPLANVISTLTEDAQPLTTDDYRGDYLLRARTYYRDLLEQTGWMPTADGAYRFESTSVANWEFSYSRTHLIASLALSDVTYASDDEFVSAPYEAIESTTEGTSTTIEESFTRIVDPGNTIIVPVNRGANFNTVGSALHPVVGFDSSGRTILHGGGTRIGSSPTVQRPSGINGVASSIADFRIYSTPPSTETITVARESTEISTSHVVNVQDIVLGDSDNTVWIDAYIAAVRLAGGDDYFAADVGPQVPENLAFDAPGAPGAFIDAGSGSDTVFGGSRADLLIGGQGDDALSGGDGDDTYVMFAGHGFDTIVDRASVPAGPALNRLVLPVSVALNDIQVTYGEIVGSTTGQVSGQAVFRTVDLRWSDTDGVAIFVPHTAEAVGSGIDLVQLGDGQVLTLRQLLEALGEVPTFDPQHLDNDIAGVTFGLGGNDTLTAGLEAAVLVGGAGYDVLVGGAGDDLLVGGDALAPTLMDNTPLTGSMWDGGNRYRGGAGNDTIFATGGADVVEFDAGDGNDTVTDLQHDVTFMSYGGKIGGDEESFYTRFINATLEDPEARLGEHRAMLESAADTLRFGAGVLARDVSVLRNWDDLVFQLATTGEQVSFRNWFRSEVNQLASVEFASGRVWDLATILERLSGVPEETNTAPFVAEAIADQAVLEGLPFALAIANAFADQDPGDALGYSATRANGEALPAWLTFDGLTGAFSGTPADADVGALTLAVTATDLGGMSAVATFELQVLNLNQAPALELPIADQSVREHATVYLDVSASFSDSDAADTLVYAAALANGNALPSWLAFDPLAGILSGTPTPADIGTFAVRVTATDPAGTSASDTFRVTVTATPDQLIFGTDDDDVLAGNSGNDTIDGRAGADLMSGGRGNDTYVVDDAGDAIVENVAEGTDHVRASVTRALDANVENLTLAGSTAIDGTGNALRNQIVGNAASNVLDGGAGIDTLRGGPGDDVYVVDRAADVVIEDADGGFDTVRSSATYAMAAHVEALVLTGAAATRGTGNDLPNVMYGNAAANLLDGGAAADTLIGGAGNDTYVVDEIGDVIVELPGEGTDTVRTWITYSLGENVERLVLLGGEAVDGTGNALNNLLTGNAAANFLAGGDGNDTLDGGGGADTLAGGTGNDSYVADHADDTVIENVGEGTEIVRSSVTHVLAANVENLTLTGTAAVDGTGNELGNVLTGNSAANTLSGEEGNDTLNGAGGADTLAGGAGDDIYVVVVAGATIVEYAGQGTDLVRSAIHYTLDTEVENLTLTGTANLNGRGNAADNTIRGNGGANLLQGLAGNDTLVGNISNDVLQGGEGNDRLSDSAGVNLLDGGAGADRLTGGAAGEFLAGGEGNDALTPGTGADVIAFNRGDGQDTVAASLGTDNTVALGGGIGYSDLGLRKSGNSLILELGVNTATTVAERITFTNWYAATADNRSVARLQVHADATSAYDPASADPLRNRRIQVFDFQGIVAAFDAARTASPALGTWSAAEVLAAHHFGGSDIEAYGGALAYQYGSSGTFAGMSLPAVQSALSHEDFGGEAQAIADSSSGAATAGDAANPSAGGYADGAAFASAPEGSSRSFESDANVAPAQAPTDDADRELVDRLQVIIESLGAGNAPEVAELGEMDSRSDIGPVSGLSSWAVTNALLQFHLSASDEGGAGEELHRWYASLAAPALQPVATLGDPSFGNDAQTLRAFSGLREGFATLT